MDRVILRKKNFGEPGKKQKENYFFRCNHKTV
jgi:hypothetical protein